MTKEQFNHEMEKIAALDWSITTTAVSQAVLCMRYIESLEAENAKLKAEIAQLKKDKLEFNAQCFHKDETISVLKNRITELESDNRSLVEQMNQTALKPNQAIIERHEYDHDNPETYPPKRRSYLCETISGFVELFWNPIGQEWHIAIGMNHIYNHFQINAYYTWAYPPKGVTMEMVGKDE